MYYGVASTDATPGRSPAPAAGLLFRTRAEASAFTPGASLVAVAARFDARRGEIRPTDPAAAWCLPAAPNSLGGLTVFGPIPASAIRVAEVALAPPAARAGDAEPGPAEFGGWDSLTMALLA